MLSLGESALPMSPVAIQEGVARLSRGTYFKEASLDMTLSLLTESAGQMTGFARISIWALANRQSELRCLDLFERGAGHRSGMVLSAADFPKYFRALLRGEVVIADEPFQHPDIVEYAREQLVPLGICAILVTPIHIRGELQGIFCIEQMGPRHPWTAVHRLFAQSVANLVTLALVEYEVDEARGQAREADERLKAVFAASRDALVLADRDTGIVIDANSRAEHLFGYPRVDLIGKHQRQLHPTETTANQGSEFRWTAGSSTGSPIRTRVRRHDGSALDVDFTAEVAEVGEGRHLVLGILRPV